MYYKLYAFAVLSNITIHSQNHGSDRRLWEISQSTIHGLRSVSVPLRKTVDGAMDWTILFRIDITNHYRGER